MDATTQLKPAKLVPFALKDAPALIEKVFPATKVSFEAQRERKAGSGQTLTALGSYWKGRKPLILVRAIVLGSLLPQTDDAEADLEVFESLMGFDLQGLARRAVAANNVKVDDIALRIELETPWVYFDCNNRSKIFSEKEVSGLTFPLSTADKGLQIRWRRDIDDDRKAFIYKRYLETLPSYEERASLTKRPEEINQDWLLAPALRKVNGHLAHLGIAAKNLPELISQLGILRYGDTPRIGDTFAGGGSIPYEAARMGANAFASDLNPIACMLNWANVNIIGASEQQREKIDEHLEEVSAAVEKEIQELGIEHNRQGDRAKHFLYCLETQCPESGWVVPMLPTCVISSKSKVIAKLAPDYEKKCFNINIISDASTEEMKAAKQGTLANGKLTYSIGDKHYSVSIKTIRQDYKDEGENRNKLRLWKKEDIKPKEDDILQERLYAIQWVSWYIDNKGKRRKYTYFASVTDEDIGREQKVEMIVEESLADWQSRGLVPDMPIERGAKTDEPIRTRGWTHWHHLFHPRQLLLLGLIAKQSHRPEVKVFIAKATNRASRLCMWEGQIGYESTSQVFTNQALNVLFNYGVRSWYFLSDVFYDSGMSFNPVNGDLKLIQTPASECFHTSDIWITDPPYADAVNYHEITEFFIAWLRKNPPAPFDQWTWDSHRHLAIKGSDDDFRRGMVDAYKAMADHMPDNGMQCVMFTHQDTGVWSDMVGIFWAAGLQVVGAWYIATETTSELKKGGYVQGTVILMLRKRPEGDRKGFTRRIYPAVHKEVENQIEEMLHLNQQVEDHTGEPVFNDADLQMAGYAAALKVLTAYTEIGGEDVTSFALRPRQKGEKTVVDEIVQQASETANGLLVPDGLKRDTDERKSDRDTWQAINGVQRFYLRMLDIETTGASKLDNYQNFAKAFRVEEYTRVMASTSPTKARLKQVEEMSSRDLMDTTELGATHLGRLMVAIQQLLADVDIKVVINQLIDELPDFLEKKGMMEDLARFLAVKATNEDVRHWAEVLGDRIHNEQLA